MHIDREQFVKSLGGEAAVERMPDEARADALEDYLTDQLDFAVITKAVPRDQAMTHAELQDRIETRNFRLGAGGLFVEGGWMPFGDIPTPPPAQHVRRLPPMPAQPTLLDFFEHRFSRNHLLQSATRALNTGMSEEVILACLLHDAAQAIIKADHGWWAAQLFEPYIPERTAFAIRYHQALRFYEDLSVGYEYPALYYRIFGRDYVPAPHIQAAYEFARNHRWYMDARMVTVNDLYAFDPNAQISIEPFLDIIGRHFKQPKEGLGNDNSAVAHMWRTIANPDSPL
jgi:hypothetical protein